MGAASPLAPVMAFLLLGEYQRASHILCVTHILPDTRETTTSQPQPLPPGLLLPVWHRMGCSEQDTAGGAWAWAPAWTQPGEAG